MVSPPVVSGTAQVGSVLTTTNGMWKYGGVPITKGATYSYTWGRCSPTGAHCKLIGGAKSKTYTVSSPDVGHTIKSRVKVTLPLVKSAAGDSHHTAVVTAKPAPGTAPVNSVTPSITGAAKVGQTLAADPGKWSGVQPINFSYQWQRCGPAGGGCGDIPAASGKTLSLDSSDLGKTMRVRVTATNSKGTSSAVSAVTAVVGKAGGGGGPKPVNGVLDVNSLASTDRLVLATTSFSPSVLTTRNPFTMRVEVTNSKGTPVSGALVYAIALPYGLVSPAPEVPTDSTGFAIITFRPTSNLPVGKSGALVFFLRARRASDPVLAGISNRRLVQVSIR